MPSVLRPTSRRRTLALGLLAFGLSGCGYSVRPPYRHDVRTVYVPMLKSQTFRRDLNQQLTRMIVEEIQRRTPFKVVGTPEEADTALEGTITMADKNMFLENPNNLPRQIMSTMVAQVKWVDNRLSYEKKQAIQPMAIIEAAPFYGEIGETAQLGFNKAMERMARQIVDSMEEKWD